MKGFPVRLRRSSLGLLGPAAGATGSVGEPNKSPLCGVLSGGESAKGLLDDAADNGAFCCCDNDASFSFCSYQKKKKRRQSQL